MIARWCVLALLNVFAAATIVVAKSEVQIPAAHFAESVGSVSTFTIDPAHKGAMSGQVVGIVVVIPSRPYDGRNDGGQRDP